MTFGAAGDNSHVTPYNALAKDCNANGIPDKLPSFMSDILILMQNMPSGTIAMLVVFIVLLLCGLGLPLPEEISLITAGYLVYLNMVELSTAIVVCMVGILLG